MGGRPQPALPRPASAATPGAAGAAAAGEAGGEGQAGGEAGADSQRQAGGTRPYRRPSASPCSGGPRPERFALPHRRPTGPRTRRLPRQAARSRVILSFQAFIKCVVLCVCAHHVRGAHRPAPGSSLTADTASPGAPPALAHRRTTRPPADTWPARRRGGAGGRAQPQRALRHRALGLAVLSLSIYALSVRRNSRYRQPL